MQRRGIVQGPHIDAILRGTVHVDTSYLSFASCARKLCSAKKCEETPWQRWGAGATHGLLYLLLIVLPITGWAASSVHGWHLTPFGLFDLPALLPKGTKLGFKAGDMHADLLSWVLLAIIGLHVLAALYHRFVKRDGVLQRMLPSRNYLHSEECGPRWDDEPWTDPRRFDCLSWPA